MKTTLALILLAFAFNVQAETTQYPTSAEFDRMADLMRSKSSWVWYPETHTLLLCFKITDVEESLCTAVPNRYQVTKQLTNNTTQNGSDIQM